MSDILVHRFQGLPAAREGEPEAPRRRRVFVDREGRIVLGDDLPGGAADDRQLSEVHPAVFAAR